MASARASGRPGLHTVGRNGLPARNLRRPGRAVAKDTGGPEFVSTSWPVFILTAKQVDPRPAPVPEWSQRAPNCVRKGFYLYDKMISSCLSVCSHQSIRFRYRLILLQFMDYWMVRSSQRSVESVPPTDGQSAIRRKKPHGGFAVGLGLDGPMAAACRIMAQTPPRASVPSGGSVTRLPGKAALLPPPV